MKNLNESIKVLKENGYIVEAKERPIQGKYLPIEVMRMLLESKLSTLYHDAQEFAKYFFEEELEAGKVSPEFLQRLNDIEVDVTLTDPNTGEKMTV